MGINTTLKELKTKLDDSFTKYAEASRQEYISTLPVGSRLPEANRIYSDAYKEKFAEEAEIIRNDAYAAIRNERDKVSAAKTNAPTAEAVNSIGLMRLTKDITESDVRDMMARYGDNYGAYRAIKSIATDAGIKDVCGTHALDKATDGLDYVERKVASSFSTTDYIRNGVQTISTLGFNAIVDNEIPD